MREAIGFDSYNLCVTGGAARTLASSRSDNEHLPCVIVINSSGGGIAGTLDSSYYKGCGERQGVEREYVVLLKETNDGNSG